MTKAKGTKGSAKAVAASAKPAPKGTKPAAKPAPAKPAAKPAPAKGPAAKAPASKPPVKAPVSKPPAAPSAPPEARVEAAPSQAAGAEGLIIKKKKVKRGAPPMLPRRLPRRPLPPLEAGSAPPPPKPTITGSLHAPARSPAGAEKLKENLTKAIGALAKLKGLKRNLQRQFWDAALTLRELSDPALYQAKGYGSWESFLEREVEKELGIGRVQAVDLVRIVKIFQKEAAEEFGQDKLRAALKALYPEPGNAPSGSETG